MTGSDVSKYVSEAIGTFVLVFTIGCNVFATKAAEATVAPIHPHIMGTLSIASALMVMIYALGPISGGHFNPAVTFGVALSQKDFKWSQAAIYMVSQAIGGCLGATAYATLFGKVIPLTPPGHWSNAGAVELHYTFLLVFTVLNVAIAQKSAGNEYFGLAIGFVIVAGGYAGAAISGAVFNPAVALAIDLVSANTGFGWCFMYIAFQMLGAAIAALIYRMVRPDEYSTTEGVSMFAKLASEFLGTYFLVYTVGLAVTHGVYPQTGALAIASALMIMIYNVGNISGAHLNPAVTLAVLISGRNKINLQDAMLYILVQLGAGMVAGVTYGLAGNKAVVFNGPAAHHGWVDAAVAEAIFTFVLAFTVLSVATTTKALTHMFGLAIGFCVVVGGYAVGGISGGHLNPAVSVGLDVASTIWNRNQFWHSLPYCGFQAIGSVLAGAAFMVTHGTEYVKSKKHDFEYGATA